MCWGPLQYYVGEISDKECLRYSCELDCSLDWLYTIPAGKRKGVAQVNISEEDETESPSEMTLLEAMFNS